MRCSRPLYAWESIAGDGRLVFHAQNGKAGTGRDVPCSKCTACRMNASRDWSIRLIHELSYSKKCCVATQTFDNEHVPDSIGDIRRFAKTLKMRLVRAGYDPRSHWLLEYGGKFDRPHAHVIFFNEDFLNRRPSDFDDLPNGKTLDYTKYYVPEFEERFWTWGNVQFDLVSPAACRYVAGHNMGKLAARKRPDGSPSHINIPAKRPAVGMRYARQFYDDFNRVHGAVVQGSLTAVPKVYRKYEPDLFQPLIEHCREYALEHASEDQWDGTVSAGERREELARLVVAQAEEAKAWHRGCHR